MTPARFLETRRPAWNRLGQLLEKTRYRGAAGLTEEELHEITRLYPGVAVDVARARVYKMDSQTQEKINHLAIAAHGVLYRRQHVRPLQAIWGFLARDYPRLFRKVWRYVSLSAALFVVGALAAYASVRIKPSRAYLFVPQGLDRPGDMEVTPEDVSERYRSAPKQIMAAGITTNNIQVAFFAFASGIAAGVGTCYVLLVNAMMLGAFFAHFANHNLSYECYSYLTPHGALEIFAILVAGGAGLRLGLSLAIPGRVTRGAALRAGAGDAVLLVLGTIPMFIVAGAIESFVTPSYLPNELKIAIGVLALAVTLAYLVLAGRGRRAQPVSAA